VTLRLLQAGALALAVATGPAAAQGTRFHPPDVKFAATPQSVVDAMLELAHVTAADVVVDLGSGDGRIPITAAQKYGARGVGVEIDERLVRISNDAAIKAGVADRVAFLNEDLFDADLRAATVVTLFLMPRVNERLVPKLRRELRTGARIVAHQFTLGDAWPPEMSRDVDGLAIYLWTIR
jgi:cyclopropane fatty-acyl-phospholipid synthase-like methyltransferase